MKKLFSSIKIKLFLWFWLITIVSIVATTFISRQLTDHTVLLPLHKADYFHLQQISKRINHLPLAKIMRWADQKRFRHSERYLSLWLTDQQGQVHAKEHDKYPEITRYLSNNQLTNPISIQFPHGRLTGPLVLDSNNQDLKIFLLSKTRHPPFGMMVMSLPRWARFAIPIVISFILCWLLARNLTKPIKQLQQASKTIAKGELSVELTDVSQRYDEIGALAQSFEHMSAQLKQHISAQQRLLGDVSHELRSPLTRLQLALGLLEKHQSIEQRQKYFARCQKEVERLEQMLADVLKLSRLENAMQTITKQELNFSQLIHEQIADAKFLAEDKKLTFHTNIPANIHLFGDSKLLASAVNNVLSNAVKYTSTQGDIWLTLITKANCVELTITDSGQGVAPEQLASLFKPFYRVNDDRARTTGGTGLGLAITKQAIELHQGTINASNSDTGLMIVIALPIR